MDVCRIKERFMATDLESVRIVDVAGDLLAPVISVSYEDNGSHLPVPVGLFSLGQGQEESTLLHWLTSTAQDTVWT